MMARQDLARVCRLFFEVRLAGISGHIDSSLPLVNVAGLARRRRSTVATIISPLAVGRVPSWSVLNRRAMLRE